MGVPGGDASGPRGSGHPRRRTRRTSPKRGRRAGTLRLEITQGVEMGRGSRLRTEIEGDRVRVGGDVVIVVDGTVFLDT